MASEIELGIETLKISLDRQNAAETLRQVEHIVQPFADDELTGAENDLGISKVFDANQGLLTFLVRSIKCNKLHKDANCKVLELFEKIINEQPTKVGKYVPAVVDVMLKFVLSGVVTAMEKERATLVLQALVSNNVCEHVDMKDVLAKLLQVFYTKKPPGRFLQNIYVLLGMCARDSPSSVGGQELALRNMFLDTLEKTLLTQNDVSYPALAGAIQGLNYFLVNFAPSTTDEPIVCQRIYTCVKKLSDPPDDFKQIQIFRLSLELFAAHPLLMGTQIFADHKYWHTVLLKWLHRYTNRDSRKMAFQAIHAFHSTIAAFCEQNSGDADLSQTPETAVLIFYIDYFKSILLATQPQPYEIRIATRGFGLLAAACNKRLPAASLAELLTLVMQRTEVTCRERPAEHRDALEHYPDFVRALSQIMQHIRSLSSIQISSLQTIIVSLIRDFCYLSPSYHANAIASLLHTFANLAQLGAGVLEALLERCTMHGVVWTCSHKLVLDSNEDWATQTDWKDHITIETFLPLWQGLTREETIEIPEHREIKLRIYRHLLDALFAILDRLNLKTRPRNASDTDADTATVNDPNRDLVPINPADFHMFFNVVQLYERLLSSLTDASHRAVFRGYAETFIATMATKSAQLPLISGFVRLMAAALKICGRLQFFETPSEELLSFFRGQVTRVQRVQGELQFACLECIFAGPTGLLGRFAVQLGAIYQIAFRLGLSDLLMAHVALRSLERLAKSLRLSAQREVGESETHLEQLLRAVLPSLDVYLQAQSVAAEVGELQASAAVRTRVRGQRRKRAVRLNENGKDSAFVVFQKEILVFLGTLDPNTCLHLIDEHNQHTPSYSLTKPDADQTIRLTLHFGNLQPQIHLDSLVPRICENAIGAPDRRTKIAACELTHSIVLYVIGTRNYGAGSVWQMLCAAMLQLGADGDVAVRQMFEPLLMQLMHFMSHRASMSSVGAALLFDCLMDGVSHPTLANVRDVAARCLREYVEWSGRQNSQQSETLPSLLKILERLKLYSFDSCSHKREGAAIAFNYLYRLLREHDALVDVAWLDVLYTFAVNFLMSEKTDDITSDLSHSEAALRNVARVLQERADVFNQPNEQRNVPPAFNGTTLSAAVEWCFAQLSTPLTQYRRQCIALVARLAPHVNRCGSVTEFLGQTQTLDTIRTVCERPVKTEIDVHHLLVSLDCYVQLIPISGQLLERSNIIPSIADFLNTTMLTIVTDQQIAAHANCLAAIVDLLVKILPCNADSFVKKRFWKSVGNSLIDVLFKLVLAPHEFRIEIPSNNARNFIANHRQLCPPEFSARLTKRVTAELQSRYEEIVETAEMYMHSTLVPKDLVNSANGILVLLQCGFELKHGTQLLNDLFEGLSEQRLGDTYAHYLLPDVRRFARLLLRMCLHFKPTKQLVDLMYNVKPLLTQNDTQSEILHGQHFLQVFESTIFNYLLESPQQSIAELSSRAAAEKLLFTSTIFRDLTQFAYKNNCHNRVLLKEMTVGMAPVVTNMFAVYNVTTGPDSAAIAYAIVDLVTSLALICPDPLIELGKRIVDLDHFLVHILSGKDIGIELKSRALILLPCLVDSTILHHEQLESALHTLQGHHFPLLSSEFPEGSVERSEYAGLFQSILDTLVASKSPTILRFVIQATASEPKHILEHKIFEALVKFVTSRAVGGDKTTLELPFEMFADQSFEPSIRLHVLKRFVVPALRSSPMEAVFEFFANHMAVVLELAASNYGVADAGWSVEHALVNRIGAYRLQEALVGIVPVDRLQQDPALLRTLTSPPKSIVGLLTAKTLATRAEIFVTDNIVSSELFRTYQCATYAAICSIVCNTQTDLVYYEKLLFKENPNKNELIWRKIIDCRDTSLYSANLRPEFDELPRRKQRLVSIRGLSTNQEALQTDRLLVQSQNVFDSSLSQDVTKIDLSNSSVRTEGEVAAAHSRRNAIELERVPINDHEVMATLCAVVTSMFEKEITPSVAGSERCRVAPMWAKHLCRTLEDSTQPSNVRYFVAKLVDNCRAYFRHYAVSMTGPLLSFLADECAARTDTHTMNFVLIDLTVTLLEWSEVYMIRTAEEVQSAKTVLTCLMENAWHERKDVFKQRLEVIRSLVQTWRDVVPLPCQALFNAITRTQRPDSRDNLCGIQLNAIVLCCNLTPWTVATSQQFFRAVLVSLDNEHTAVYQPASYLLGMILARMVPIDAVQDNPLVEIVCTKLEKLRVDRTHEKRFTDILFGLHKHFPSIAAHFLVSIANFIPTSAGVVKRMYLELFHASMDTYGEEVFRELSALGLKDLLRADEYQLIALHCVNKALPHITTAHLKSIVSELSNVIRSKQVECRRIAFEIFIYIVTHTQDIDLRNESVSNLLVGLTDAESTIKSRVFHFWSNCKQLPATVDGRMLALLDILYDPRVEEHFLAYGTQLLLEPAIQSEEAKRPVFPHQPVEEDVKLTEYDIDVSWSGRNGSMRAPLFMQSQLKSINAASQLKATQNSMVFEPTQDPSHANADTLAHSNFSSLNSQTSMLFTVAPQMLNRRSQRVNAAGVEEGAAAANHSFAKLRERFLREKTGAVTVNRKWVDHSRSKELRKQTIKPHHRVQLYRRYRHGDFPDLLINNLALLMPLQALAQCDKQLAGHIFVAIYNATVTELGALSKQFLISTADYIQRIFGRTKHCDPVVFSTLMELALVHPTHFDFPTDLVGSLAISNQNLALAICYLERRLHIDWETDGPPTTVKTSDSNVQVEQQHWLKLIDLYRALAENDVVSGIFADKLNMVGKIPAAISMELNGDLKQAHQVFREVIERGKILEQDFSYKSYFELFERMGDWSALAKVCEGQVDTKEDFWADDWSLDTLLPHMMRATCRQVLNGSEECREFLKVIEQWVRSPEKAEQLNLHFGEDLMMLHMAAGQHNHARVYAERKLLAFLSEWPNLAVLSTKVRTAKLLSIRTVAEMHSCSQMLVDKSPSDTLLTMAKGWRAARPQSGDSTLLWDTIVAYRNCVAKAFVSGNSVYNALTDAVQTTKFRLLEIALGQRNVELSNRIIEHVAVGSNELPWLVARSQHQSLKALIGKERRTNGSQMKLHLKAWDGLTALLAREVELKPFPDVKSRALEELSCVAERLMDLVPNLQPDEQEWIQEVRQRINANTGDNLEVRLFEHSLVCLQNRLPLVEALQTAETSNFWFECQSPANVYFKLALFCQQSQRNRRLDDKIPNADKTIIESLLRAIKFGSLAARQMFPTLLEMEALQTNAELKRLFNHNLVDIPDWMFLSWIPQILSVLPFESASFVDELVLRIAKTYPLAIAYPFRLSYEHFQQNLAPNSPDPRPFVSRLIGLLQNPTTDTFVRAMQCLCVPEKKLAHHLLELFHELGTITEAEVFKRRLRYTIQCVWPVRHDSLNGRSFERIAMYRSKIENLEDVDAFSVIEKTIREILASLDTSVRQKVHKNDSLRTLSPWLLRFQWCGRDSSHLEMPGQFTGDRRPDPTQQVLIVKFSESVEIFETLRYPIRVGLHGSDGQTYSFLIKFGEDLRQDQRVQQMLGLMSDQLRADAHCRAHAMHLETYAVIPLSVHCGMLGWVKDSPPMMKVVEKWMERRKQPLAKLPEFRHKHASFIKKASGPNVATELKHNMHYYGKAAVGYSRMQIINSFREIEYSVPVELIRGAVYDLAATPQSFFALRTNFAASQAALSVAHWLLGIGDRHLSNVLLNVRTGRVVGIDFGLAFGAGTRDQNVPELLPFRLTPQFVTVMSPLGLTGVITKGMGHALRCFREGRSILQSCMEVFIREPTINWLVSARNRVLQEDGVDERIADERWEPAYRIAVFGRKLDGANPAGILADELSSGKIAAHPEYLEAYLKLLAGEHQHNIRARLAAQGLTAEQQVQCLLDMATDPALLGISWTGMQPWI